MAAYIIALNMSRIAAERAVDGDWQEHPMFGIEVDSDKWALAYQEENRKLKEILIPHLLTKYQQNKPKE